MLKASIWPAAILKKRKDVPVFTCTYHPSYTSTFPFCRRGHVKREPQSEDEEHSFFLHIHLVRYMLTSLVLL